MATSPLSSSSIQNPKDEPLVGLFTMFYRHPSVGNFLISKNFRCSGSLRDARERAEQHCSVMGGKLNFVQPLITNLALEEDYKLNGAPSATAPAAAQGKKE